MIAKSEVERFSLISSRPFDEVIAGVNAGIGHPDMAEFARSTHEARSFAELKGAVEKGLSKVGLMLSSMNDLFILNGDDRDEPIVVRRAPGENPWDERPSARPDRHGFEPRQR
jgi:hypothetical protein